MPWQQQGGGGPWGGGGGSNGDGGGGGGRGPWGGGSGGGGGGRRGGGSWGGGQPPDLEEVIRKSQERFKRFLPGGLGPNRGIAIVVAVIIGLWALSGFYRVQPDQQGVVLVFGEWVKTTSPGLNWNWPYPVGEVETPTVEKINSIDIGFQQSRGGARDIPDESLMLTGDQNIIDIDFTVQWKIADAGMFLFNIRDPEATIKIVAESAMREVIGQTDIQPALTEARSDVEARTKSRLQGLLVDYEAGVEVTEVKLQDAQPPQPVIDAFSDVQRALQDRDRAQNEADAYRNKIIPEARGEAQRMIQGAEAYKERIINEAEGEAERFNEVYAAYRMEPELTQQRMYLETVQGVLRDSSKIIMNRGGTGAVPYLPLDRLIREPGTGGSQRSSSDQQN